MSQYSAVFAPMAVEAVLKVLDPKAPQLLDLKNIRVVTKLGSTIDESELVEGVVFDQKASKSAGGPTRIEKAKVGLIQVFCHMIRACLTVNARIQQPVASNSRCCHIPCMRLLIGTHTLYQS